MAEPLLLQRYRDLIPDWPAFVEACQAPLPTTLWTNTLRTTTAAVGEMLRGDGIELVALPWYARGFRAADGTRPGKHLGYQTGLFHIQEEVSMLPIALLDPQPGERVLDLCAAPGNKSVQAAVQMKGRGHVIANDISHHRLGMVTRSLERLGITCVATMHGNGANLGRSAGLYDRVLVDVPCSCEGTTRKNPQLLERRQVDVYRRTGGQVALLRKAVQLCRSGGRIVYSTCTYAPEENELVVDTVLREDRSLDVLAIGVDGLTTRLGLDTWDGTQLDPRLPRTLRLYPHDNNTGGFYVAVLEKATD